MKIEADLVVLNGNIITMDPAHPNASALAVKNFKLLAVGRDEDVEELLPSAKRVIDLGGKTVVPGFVDAHTHITAEGLRASHVDLTATKSVEDVKKELSASLSFYKPGDWVLGHGWDESQWSEKRYLTAKDLDEVSAEHAIMIDRIDGHLTVANSAALKKLGISLKHEGVMKDKKGKPTGVLKDIEDLYSKITPTPEEIQKGVVRATRIANMHGITTAVDNIRSGFLRHIRECELRNELTARLVVNPGDDQMIHMVKLGITSGMGTPMVKIGGVKVFTDGSIGARTAAISGTYKDDKKNHGRLLTTPKKLSKLVHQAVESGIQTVIHAIGDAAIEMVISTFEKLNDSERALVRRQRHRIEHAEMVSEDQIRRATSLGLILSMQPNFVGKWQLEGGLYETRLEEEVVRGMNMFRVALDNGARVCFGSDGMPYGPLYGIWCAATHPNKRVQLTAEEALRCYTLESAYASFVEGTVGSIAVGKRADFAVLSDNILRARPESIADIRVENTFVGGKEEFSAAKNRGV